MHMVCSRFSNKHHQKSSSVSCNVKFCLLHPCFYLLPTAFGKAAIISNSSLSIYFFLLLSMQDQVTKRALSMGLCATQLRQWKARKTTLFMWHGVAGRTLAEEQKRGVSILEGTLRSSSKIMHTWTCAPHNKVHYWPDPLLNSLPPWFFLWSTGESEKESRQRPSL